MKNLEYIDPSDWSLHVIDGENEGVPEGWVLVPEGATLLVKLKHLNICVFYRMVNGIWGSYESGEWADFPENYRHIENPILKDGYEILWTRKMKEYLVERDGKYELVEAYHLEDGIEVPEGAFFLKFFKDPLADFCFYKENYTHIWQNHEKHKYWGKLTIDQSKVVSDSGVILWQRNPSLNDKYSKIEEVHQGSVEATLAERQKQYGCFEDVAFVTEKIIAALKYCNFDDMPFPHKTAMYMIASKMARIVSGDFNYKDNWHDIGGYAKLIERLIGEDFNG